MAKPSIRATPRAVGVDVLGGSVRQLERMKTPFDHLPVLVDELDAMKVSFSSTIGCGVC